VLTPAAWAVVSLRAPVLTGFDLTPLGTAVAASLRLTLMSVLRGTWSLKHALALELGDALGRHAQEPFQHC
jgi:hypothetical protein